MAYGKVPFLLISVLAPSVAEAAAIADVTVCTEFHRFSFVVYAQHADTTGNIATEIVVRYIDIGYQSEDDRRQLRLRI